MAELIAFGNFAYRGCHGSHSAANIAQQPSGNWKLKQARLCCTPSMMPSVINHSNVIAFTTSRAQGNQYLSQKPDVKLVYGCWYARNHKTSSVTYEILLGKKIRYRNSYLPTARHTNNQIKLRQMAKPSK